MNDFWRERRVFLTGHTGFKGSWLALFLQQLGARVVGYALPPHTEPNLHALVGGVERSIIGDIRDLAGVRDAVTAAKPHVVIHMGAQALVREAYRDPLATFATNVMGTAHVLQACRESASVQCVLIVTSDKVYENLEAGLPFEEGDRLGGHDPYSGSKACAELLTASFRDSFFQDGPPVATARAGNVIGGGDWSADRLIPDCVRALHQGAHVQLRFPDAVRPWQHVLEPLAGYLALAQALAEGSAAPRAVNFGPEPASFCKVSEVVDTFSSRFGGAPGWRGDTGEHPREAMALTLSSGLAGRLLGWHPKLSVAETVAWTADWYKAHAAGEDMLNFCKSQLHRYRSLTGAQA